jgi:hypothetical protein
MFEERTTLEGVMSVCRIKPLIFLFTLVLVPFRVIALNEVDLKSLQSSVREMCLHPDRAGTYLKIEGDLNANAVLKIAGVSADGKITKESWEGLNQRLDQYKTDPRACAIEVLKILVPLMGSNQDPKNTVTNTGNNAVVIQGNNNTVGSGQSK